MKKYVLSAILWYFRKQGWFYGEREGLLVFGKRKWDVNRAITSVGITGKEFEEAYNMNFSDFEEKFRRELKALR